MRPNDTRFEQYLEHGFKEAVSKQNKWADNQKRVSSEVDAEIGIVENRGYFTDKFKVEKDDGTTAVEELEEQEFELLEKPMMFNPKRPTL